jgi:hypothetical protein
MTTLDAPSAPSRRLGALLLALGLAATTLVGISAAPARADTVCSPGDDTCVVLPTSVQTPLGLVTVTVSAGNVVTVSLAPTSRTLVIGNPFAVPPGPPCLSGFVCTSIDTAGGVVDIDTVVVPPGLPGRFALPSLAVVSIHPPGPCRVRTLGNTVVFTPIAPPGPLN